MPCTVLETAYGRAADAVGTHLGYRSADQVVDGGGTVLEVQCLQEHRRGMARCMVGTHATYHTWLVMHALEYQAVILVECPMWQWRLRSAQGSARLSTIRHASLAGALF
eukprot:365578-Chlamydomonas_euryale.AAC.7